MHELGREAGERRADHRNPLAPLSLFLPEAPDTVARLGAGDLRVVNLLYSHGVLDAARHGEVVGPHGAHGEPLQVPAFRPLTDVEKTAAVSLATTEVAAAPNLFAETAVLMDTTAELIATDAADVLLVRFGALDVLTHAAFAGTVSGTQDDGAGVLFDLYRYLDARTAEIAAALDADDVLLVVSDHGARTALQHDEAALFVAAGAGIPAGVRLDGTPDWRGLPRLIGELAGVPDAVADFPRSSLSDMLTPLPEDPP